VIAEPSAQGLIPVEVRAGATWKQASPIASGASDVNHLLQLGTLLREARQRRGLTVAEVARVTKIQARILSRIEQGDRTGLPAEVFVRGFIRSFARCVGLDGDGIMRTYLALHAGNTGATVQAILQSVGGLAPRAAEAAAEVLEVVAGEQPVTAAIVAQLESAPHPASSAALSPDSAADSSADSSLGPPGEPHAAPPETVEPAVAVADLALLQPITTEEHSLPVSARSSKRRRRASRRATATATATATVTATVAGVAPSQAPVLRVEPVAGDSSNPAWLVDDAIVAPVMRAAPRLVRVIDETVEHVASTQSARGGGGRPSHTHPHPHLGNILPLLTERDRNPRQGGLTLAVIILLIAATLTLSYLMRRPSSSGEGVTALPSASSLVG
jgi:hypothetical protein